MFESSLSIAIRGMFFLFKLALLRHTCQLFYFRKHRIAAKSLEDKGNNLNAKVMNFIFHLLDCFKYKLVKT